MLDYLVPLVWPQPLGPMTVFTWAGFFSDLIHSQLRIFLEGRTTPLHT